MPLNKIVAIALVTFLLGLILLCLFWPTRPRAVRLLRKWGVAEPDDRAGETTRRYLRRRRFAYPFLCAGEAFLPLDSLSLADLIFVTLLVGGLLAELLAQRPVRGPRREAILMRRTLTDLIPLWT